MNNVKPVLFLFISGSPWPRKGKKHTNITITVPLSRAPFRIVFRFKLFSVGFSLVNKLPSIVYLPNFPPTTVGKICRAVTFWKIIGIRYRNVIHKWLNTFIQESIYRKNYKKSPNIPSSTPNQCKKLKTNFTTSNWFTRSC